MSDLIYREDAINAMTNTLWHYPNECYRNLNKYEFAKGLAELGLKSVPSAQPKSPWILCSERLPEENQDVLLMMPHNMVVGFWEDSLCYSGRTWYANSGDGYFTDMDVLIGYDDPIAWMPLPEPYTERRTG